MTERPPTKNELKSRLRQAFDEIDRLRRAGTLAGNCCYNLAQSSKLDEHQRRCCADAVKEWDAASVASRKVAP
jgi:hypothetical protein